MRLGLGMGLATARRVRGIPTSTAFTADNVPNAFTFTDVTAQEKSSAISSAAVTITGINTGSPITVSGDAGAAYSINGGAFTSAAGLAFPNDQVRAQVTSSSADLTATNATVTIGGVSDTFTSTTGDSVPNAFTFTDVTGQAQSSTITSAAVTITGLTISSPITVTGDTGAAYSINGGTFVATAGTVVNNDQVRAQVTSASAPSTAKNCTVTIGGVSDTFTATTT